MVLQGLLDAGDSRGQPVPRHVVGGLGERAQRAGEGTGGESGEARYEGGDERSRDEKGGEYDLGVVAETCDRVIVMYAGEIVEEGDVMQILTRPRHPYTRALLAATPRNDVRVERLPTIRGSMPAAWEWPRGCRFAPRCAYALPACSAAPVRFVDGARCIRVHELEPTGTVH